MDPKKLRQQAKGLLLKGCYRMAINKYKKLIELGADGFSPREWSIVHLNLAISLQFQDQLEQSLLYANKAIQIDPTYEKAFYRRLQILRDLERFQEAIESVPGWLSNKQVNDLISEIRESFLNSLGLGQMMEKMIKGKADEITARQSHKRFQQRVIEIIQGNRERLQELGKKVAEYYVFLKELKDQGQQLLESFLEVIYRLLARQKQNGKNLEGCKKLLHLFWEKFCLVAQPILQNKSQIQHLQKMEYRLIKYMPLRIEAIKVLEMFLNQIQNLGQNGFIEVAQILGNLSQESIEIPPVSLLGPVQALITNFLRIQTALRPIQHLKRVIILGEGCIRLHIKLSQKIILKEINSVNVHYLRYHYLMKNDRIDINVPTDKIVSFFQDQIDTALSVIIFQQIVHKLDRNVTKTIIPEIIENVESIRELKKISKNKNPLNKDHYEVILLTLCSLLLKIDLKQAGSLKVEDFLESANPKQHKFISDARINGLMLLCLSGVSLIPTLKLPQKIIALLESFLAYSFPQQIESVQSLTSLLFLLVCDFEEQQQEIIAKKMGVTREEVQKARKLQGESQKNDIVELSNARNQLAVTLVKKWGENIWTLCGALLRMKEEGSLLKMGKILVVLVKVQASRFYHTKIVELQLQIFKTDPRVSGLFFSQLCKKMNPQMLKYQQLQAITNILVFSVEGGEHQLTIFESLLGLINFTSSLSSQIKIPLAPVQRALLEENQYIVHGALELINNLLLQDNETAKPNPSLIDLVQKYLNHYRQQVRQYAQSHTKSCQLPLSDYSHPCKIYSTLLSLAIVLQLDKVQQFSDWSTTEDWLLRVAGSRALTLFKCVIYMQSKGRLKGPWWNKFGQDLNELEKIDRQKWIKIQHLIR